MENKESEGVSFTEREEALIKILEEMDDKDSWSGIRYQIINKGIQLIQHPKYDEKQKQDTNNLGQNSELSN
tara:strand:- start:4248 stop:4460 length:213 start_codon:yes stop_codon:yes gene_type:complete